MFKKPEPDPGLEKLIADCQTELLSMSTDTKEYKEAQARYMTYKIFQADQKPKKVSYDAILSAGTSLLGILLILHHEKASVVTTKALGFVKKAF